jgi:hypothetical protein
MTEAELKAHRRAQDLVNAEAHQAALDTAAAQLSAGDAIEVVSRHEAAGGSDREYRRHNLRLACALRLCGATQKEIAAELGISTSQVHRLLHEGQQLTQRHTLTVLETRAMPLAIDNLIAGLENGDQKYTLETLKGGGILKAHTRHDGSFSGPPVAMQIVFAAPPGGQTSLPDGAAHGRPMTIDVSPEE